MPLESSEELNTLEQLREVKKELKNFLDLNKDKIDYSGIETRREFESGKDSLALLIDLTITSPDLPEPDTYKLLRKIYNLMTLAPAEKEFTEKEYNHASSSLRGWLYGFAKGASYKPVSN